MIVISLHDIADLNLITDYMKDKLFVLQADSQYSTFQWSFIVSWVCEHCDIKYNDDTVTIRDNITFMAKLGTFTVQDTLDNFLITSVRHRYCEICDKKTKVERETIAHPNIMHLSYPAANKNGVVDIPVFLDEVIITEGVVYNLIGAVYGDGGHFVFRYLRDGKVYEADGMDTHPTSTYHKKIRAALSREITGPSRISLAGIINYKDKNYEGKQAIDIYYMKADDSIVANNVKKND